jgi:hypothetical protein
MFQPWRAISKAICLPKRLAAPVINAVLGNGWVMKEFARC